MGVYLGCDEAEEWNERILQNILQTNAEGKRLLRGRRTG
jgi:hypothetical protein